MLGHSPKMIFGKRHYKNSSDERLIELIHKGNTSAFNELFQRYSQKLLFYFFRMLGGDKERAQDLLQDIFLKLIEKRGMLAPIKNFSSWIFTVAHNMCKNEYRNKKVRDIFDTNYDLDSFADNNSDPGFSFERPVDRKFFNDVLIKKLNIMTVGQRSTFLLKFQEGFTIKEISQILHCSEGTIKSRLFYTTKQLAKTLQAYNPNAVEV